MKEQTMHWLDIGKVQDIPVQGARRIHLDDITIAVFRTTANEVYALEDRCPHANGPLSDGIVHGDCVTCPLHGWDISLRDGSAQGEDKGHVQRFEVRQEGERLLLAQNLHTQNIDVELDSRIDKQPDTRVDTNKVDSQAANV